MTVLKSKVNSKDIKFLKNQKQLSVDYKLTHKAVEIAMNGGGKELNDRHQKRGKMLPRHRVSKLLDPGSAFLEVGLTAGYNMYNCLLYTSPSPRDNRVSRMPSSA